MRDNDRLEDHRGHHNQRRRSQAQEGIQDDTPHRRRDPYKRDRADYNDYLQEEALEDEWFEKNN